MTMIEQMMDDCVLYNHIRTDDGYGGTDHEWQEGATFKASIIKNNSTEATIAEKQGVAEVFTVVVPKGFVLEYHDAFKRLKDGSVFRVTGTTTDNEAPEASTVKISKVTAERWSLPDG